MKVIQVNTVCGAGSVGKICVDLYHVCEAHQIEARIAYGRNKHDESIQAYKIGDKADMITHVLQNFIFGKSGFASKKVTEKFLDYLDREQPDILHLHNLHGFYLHVKLLFDYIKEKNIKTVWTLHDCWAFTGHCAYFDYAMCDKWKEGCNHCKIHRTSYPYSIFKDNSKDSFLLKKETFTGVKNLTIVTPSYWLKELVEQSYLKEYPVRVIHNGINLSVFKPRVEGKVPMSPYILGVANVWEARKGLVYFEKLARDLKAELEETGKIPYKIVLVGLNKKQKKNLENKYGNVLTGITRTENADELAKIYSRALVYVNMTLEDNFPTTNIEALACGTPVVTFDTGGSKESLDETCGTWHEKGKYHEVKFGINKMVSEMKTTQNQIRACCIKRAARFDKDKRFLEYLELYSEI